jgi:hypothetical protein
VHRRRALAVLALAAAALTAVAGCGSAANFLTAKNPEVGPGNQACHCADAPTIPQQALDGVTALLDHDALTATVTLDADPAMLDAVFAADADSPLSPGAAGTLAGATLVFAATTGGGSFRDLAAASAPAKNGSYSLTLDTRTTPTLVQVVGTPATLYARADVNELLGLLGGTRASGPLHIPNLPAPLAKAVAGEWVSINLADLTTRPGASTPSVGPSQAAVLAQSLETIFHKDVTATRAAPDPKLGQHLVLSGNARTIGADLRTATKAVTGLVPDVSNLLGSSSAQLPDKTIKIDEYVRDGTASAFRFDLTQLLNPAEAKAAAGRPAMLDIDLTPTAAVTVPAHATPLDLSTLAPLLGGLLGTAASP